MFTRWSLSCICSWPDSCTLCYGDACYAGVTGPCKSNNDAIGEGNNIIIWSTI